MKILLLILIFLTACSQEQEEITEESYDIHGKYMGGGNSSGVIRVFVEDNYGGKNIKMNKPEELDESYHVEAYLIELTDETIFIDGSTGKEVESPHFSRANFSVSVNVLEAFEREVQSNYPNYINYQFALLPHYTADTLKVYPITPEDYLGMFSPVEEGKYVIISFIDRTESPDKIYELHQKFLEIQEDGIAVEYFSFNETQQELLEVNEVPSYFLLDKNGQILRTPEWEIIEQHLYEQKY
ncbi:hypothetical protein LGQ02_04910 [Bacillus shivajii]|uniref:hypothetical protein n=1 Tax=Bacillus shivajii TaxID=1983719 RepID=UPI001CFA58F1|nr:hypothetical protein [Bacillus shivajii]UCZ54123.1 hypothetical protein LGQ02_04910 [Bacillus shivajii]